ncbi:DUF423 domain-containing protein [Stappia sp. MMSF_3263]|uniref:DUF423 domain-containing protein n=1 Tax=Stappia sp. MMSF_3263 TaxID=3046693 RepID=UPI00273EA496|nr:DUF423 domain-containing protein [Stappia sp. MMSF_3263]
MSGDRPVPAPNGACLLAAGLSGLAGVALSAAAAHSAAANLLDPAARMLLFHAPAFLALALLVPAWGRGGAVRRVLALGAAALALGLLLFCGDLCARAWLGHRLFAFAAPLGGTLLMSGWLAILLAGVMRIAARPA